ncbi:phosphatidylinositol-specific phospholipase C, partial [Kitasatospora sp. MBT63]|uniref:phosphatidylinositol-specific phospholipase C n=1 Tax=Kitasatospora sp. MBT63 TaxID=1444768 RepID=UPI00068C7281
MISRRELMVTSTAAVAGVVMPNKWLQVPRSGSSSATAVSSAAASGFSTSSWMAGIPGDRDLSALTLPGTHDSGALYGGGLAQTQTLSLTDQLNSGIRYFDIRCRHIQNTFAIHHGLVFQNLMFGSGVRDVFVSFLKVHPTECIVMSVQEEYTPTGNTRSFEDTFDSYVFGFESYFYLDDRTPTLDSARGKIVLLRGFDAQRTPKGITKITAPAGSTGNSTGPAVWHIQGDYNINTIWDINPRINVIEGFMAQAAVGSLDEWYLNAVALSSSNGGVFPVTAALGIAGTTDGVNAALRKSISSYPNVPGARLGLYGMDFPDQTLINMLIASNGFQTGPYDLKSTADRIIPIDFYGQGMATQLMLFRPGSGAAHILDAGAGFAPIYQCGAGGIGGYDLRSDRD